MGEVKRAAGEAVAQYKVLAVRMEVGELEALDRAWQAGGYESRVAFIREAVSATVNAAG